MSLPRGILQDMSFILLAKSRELTLSEDFDKAQELLKALEEEVHKDLSNLPGNLAFKLGRLVNWEILLVSIIKFLNNWPVMNPTSEPLDLKTKGSH